MISTNDATSLVPAFTEAALAIADHLGLPARAAGAGETGDVPPGATAALAALLVGIEGMPAGRLVLAVDAPAADTGLGRLSEAATAGLAGIAAVTGPLRLSGPELTDPAAALASCLADEGAVTVVVPLTVGGTHRLTLAVAVEQPAPATAEMPPLAPSPAPAAPPRPLASLSDVELNVTVELGRTRLPVRDLLGLHPGAVVQLDRPVSAPVDIFANGTLIARGEVVVVDDDYGVRVIELVDEA